MYYSKELIKKAKEMDLLTYLRNYDPNELIHFSRETYMTKTHDSLKISNGMWYWFSQGIGGKTALEYLIKVRNYSFLEAVQIILDCKRITLPNEQKNYVEKENIRLILPKKSSDNHKIKRYLLSRGIDLSIVNECIDNDLIYEDLPQHNVVFLGYDNDRNIKYASVRGSNNTRFMKEAYGSNKAYSFKIEGNEKNSILHIFESAIDLLSYATLLKMEGKEWNDEHLLSLAGVYQPASKINESKIPIALNNYLNKCKAINKIFLHLDNDKAGRMATLALKEIIPRKYQIIDSPVPIGKDVNDFLCFKKNIKIKNNKEKER